VDAIGNDLSRRRRQLGLTQLQLAERAGLSRQALNGLEGGRAVPSTAIALRLAQVLDCKLDELFWLSDSSSTVEAELADSTGLGGSRVTVASVGGKWVAHPLVPSESLSAMTTADAILKPTRGKAGARTVKLHLLTRPAVAQKTLVCAGCAPAMGILAARAGDGASRGRVVWLDRPSLPSLELLRRGQVHVAGAHLFDEAAREFNVPAVQRLFPHRAMLVVNLVRWEAGLLVAPGNPKGIRRVEDLTRKGVRVVKREPGAAAQQLLMRLLRRAGRSKAPLDTRGPTARNHWDVARIVAMGLADAGVAVQSAAESFGLPFLPVAEERFDLIVPQELSTDPRVVQLLETVSTRAFRSDAEGLGGIAARQSGKIVAQIAA
jgi:putative molybdopterin biosynthesis protein